ncbi:MAG: P1 family peptidase [Candidatus Adiutrix intracellularis]|jgi:L-aminopeptidase/D-esterase-like protein|nr:P1 family peptidase [Candidatus Adiutrix intracellularis]
MSRVKNNSSSGKVSFSLSQVDGFWVGHAENSTARTGCTAILTPEGAVASFFTPGFAPGSRETELLKPESTPQNIHGLLLTGGSAFGLAAATGIVKFLREKGVGLNTGTIQIPLVPGAVIYDYPQNLSQGLLPDENMGYEAAKKASKKALKNGPYGAGFSASSGKAAGPEFSSPSGLGSAGLVENKLQLAALVIVNPLGSLINPHTGVIISGIRTKGGQLATREEILDLLKDPPPQKPGHTILVAIGTNARLDKLGAFRLARLAASGLTRSIFPSHLLFDGDIIFSLSSNTGPLVNENWLGAMAAELVSQAVINSVPLKTPPSQ